MSDKAEPKAVSTETIEMWAESNYVDSILHLDSPVVSILVIVHKPDGGSWCVTADITTHNIDGSTNPADCTTSEITPKPGVPDEVAWIAARHHAAAALAKSRLLVMAGGFPSEMHVVEVKSRGADAFKVLCSQPWATVRCEGPDGEPDMSADSETKARASIGLGPKPTIPVVEADDGSIDFVPIGRGGMLN